MRDDPSVDAETFPLVGSFREEFRSAPTAVKVTVAICVSFATWLVLWMMFFIPYVILRWGFSYNLS